MTEDRLQWLIRNKDKLSPGQRAALRKWWDENRGPKSDPTIATASGKWGPPRTGDGRMGQPRETSPADLDPLESSATPISPNPALRSKPQLTDVLRAANTLGSLENFDAAFQANGFHYPSAISAFTQQLIDKGVAPAYAERAARARAEEHRTPGVSDVYADEMKATEDPTELYPNYRNAPSSGGTPSGYGDWAAGMAEAETGKTRAERLADADATDARWDRMKDDYDRATGMEQPVGLAGDDGYRDWSGWKPGDPPPERPRMGPTALESARARQEASRLDAIESKYGPRARGIAERGDAEGVTDYDAVKSPQERQMNTYRRAIEHSARFNADTELRDDSRETLRALDKSRAKTNKEFRGRVAAAPKPAADPRMQQWIAQSMLAGGQPTGGPRGTKAATNALLMMNDPNLSEDQKSSLRYMLPGGHLAAAVDAQNMQNANDVIKRFMTSGAAAGMNNPLAQAQAQMAQQQADAAKPVQLRAQEHVAEGRLNHPDVLQHADDIVHAHYSSRPGALGVSSRFTDNEVMLGAQRLADDTGMPIAEAEKLMRRLQADRNRNSVASTLVAPFYDQ